MEDSRSSSASSRASRRSIEIDQYQNMFVSVRRNSNSPPNSQTNDFKGEDSYPNSQTNDFKGEGSYPNSPTNDFKREGSYPNSPTNDFKGEDSYPNSPTNDFKGEGSYPNSPTNDIKGEDSYPNFPTNDFGGEYEEDKNQQNEYILADNNAQQDDNDHRHNEQVLATSSRNSDNYYAKERIHSAEALNTATPDDRQGNFANSNLQESSSPQQEPEKVFPRDEVRNASRPPNESRNSEKASPQSGTENVSPDAQTHTQSKARNVDNNDDKITKETQPSASSAASAAAAASPTEQSQDPKDEGSPPTRPARESGVSVVTIIDQVQAANDPPKPAHKRLTSGRRRIEKELERMKEADENRMAREKAHRQEEIQKAIAAMHDRKRKDGVTLTQDVEASRRAIQTIVKEEEKMALEKDQKVLRKETKEMKDKIADKYGLNDKKQGRDLLALAESFYHGKVKDIDCLPEEVRRELTRQEIQDLRMVFDMFDMKGKGYIVANDVKRAASMLGFKAKKEIFSGMIEEVTGNKRGKINFVHFLKFVIKGQGDGDDHLEDILQCFGMLDRQKKGYLTAHDIRQAADSQDVPLSNRAIREMIQEADLTGDARITPQEFVNLMLQTSMFRSAR